MGCVAKNKQQLSQRVSFYPHHPGDPGKPGISAEHNTPILLLRQGRYVLFPRAIDGSALTLQDDESLAPCPEQSYIVFSIDQENAPSPDWVVSQRVAMLLTHLKEGNPNAEQAPIEFLKSTLTGYSNFDRLKRYQELLEKQQKEPGHLTPEEHALMEHIATTSDLKPFLPDKQ